MLIKQDDAYGIELDDVFLNFTNHGRDYNEGVVVAFDEDNVDVDYADLKVRYERKYVNLYLENCGFVREFYASPKSGEIIERFN